MSVALEMVGWRVSHSSATQKFGKAFGKKKKNPLVVIVIFDFSFPFKTWHCYLGGPTCQLAYPALLQTLYLIRECQRQ